MDEMSWPTSCNGKVVRHIVPFKISNLHYNWWEAGQLLEVIVNPPLEVPTLNTNEFMRFYLAKIQTRSNMKLQLRISHLAFFWIL